MIKKTGLLGVFIKTHSSKYPINGLGGGEFEKIITQYSESLNPQDWDYSNFEQHIPKDIVIYKSLLFELFDLKTIYKHLVKEAHKQMDLLEYQQIDLAKKNLSNSPYPLPNHLVTIEIEGKRLEINWFFRVNGTMSFVYLSGLINNLLEEIKLGGKVGTLFYSKEVPDWKRSI